MGRRHLLGRFRLWARARPVPAERALVALGVRHENAQRFLVVTRARSGSNMLISALRSHPHVYVEGELLQHVGHRSPSDVLDGFFNRSRPRSVRAVGCKVFYYHPLDGDPAAMWEAAAAVPDLRLVHLRRWNRLRTVTSRLLADQDDAWVLPTSVRPSEAGYQPAPLTLAEADLAKAFEETEAYERAFEERFAGCPRIDVRYEDLVSDVDAALRPVLSFLAVDRRSLQPATVRQHPQPLSSLISNYDELARAFAGTRWAEYFNE